jgi:hypothetical protein
MSTTKENAHELIDRLAPGQLTVVVGLLELILGSAAHSVTKAPLEEKSISELEDFAPGASKEWLKNDEPVPPKEELTGIGLGPEVPSRSTLTPFKPHGSEK